MTGEGLRYDALVEDALRGVVRRALSYAAERGLPGDHHFYVTFNTNHPGVEIPVQLRERYPNEMTIVLQYQFWGLDVGEDAFGVTLSFADVPERLTIPFLAITAFADPSVQFGLQFESDKSETEPAKRQKDRDRNAETTAREYVENRERIRDLEAKATKRKRGSSVPESPRTGARQETDSEPKGDKIVQLDIFRKK